MRTKLLLVSCAITTGAAFSFSTAAQAQSATCGTYAAGAITQPAEGNGGTSTTNTACGVGAVVTAPAVDGTAIGANATASDVNTTALGSGATAVGRSSTAIGSGGVASRPVIAGGGFSTAVGTGSQTDAAATGATAIGDFNTIAATGSFGVTVG